MELFKLDTIYRQAQESPIIQNAVRINNGITQLVQNDNFKIYRYNFSQNEQVAPKAIGLLTKHFGYRVGKNPFVTQILTPIKKESTGVNLINKMAQQILNKNVQKGRFKVGDKIIFTKNNYKEGYFNGDIGIIKEIKEDNYVISLQEDIVVPKECDEDIQLAYAITIHKSQGSEYDNVIIILPKNGILKRNLIYTAITRAKRNVIIISEEDALEQAIQRDVKDKRNSGLIDFLDI